MTPLLLILVVLATFRLTVLVTTDRITTPLRRKIAGWHPKFGDTDVDLAVVGRDDVFTGDGTKVRAASRPRLAYLVKCDWCTSVWLAPWPSTVAVLWPSNRVVWCVLVALAASAVTGVLSAVVSLVTAMEERVGTETKMMTKADG